MLRAVQPQRPPSEIIGRDAFASGIDIDFEDDASPESGEAEAQEAGGEETDAPRSEGGRTEYRGDYRQDRRPDNRSEGRPEARQGDDRGWRDREGRDNREGGRDGQRYEGRRDDRGYRRDDRPRDERPRDERPREDRPRDERPRDERPREDRPRDDRGWRDDRRGERWEGRGDRSGESAERDPLAVVEPEATPLTAAAHDEGARTLRSEDGGFSPAPAFLQSRVDPGAETPEAAPPEPRRRRSSRTTRAAAQEAPAADES